MRVDATRRRLLSIAPCVALGASKVLAQSRPALEVGVLPNISTRVLLAQYQPLREFLERDLRRPVQVSTAPSWSSFHARTLAGEYDLVATAAHVARLAQLDAGWQPLATYMPDLQALLITATAQPIRQVSDLRGETLALANPQSLVAIRGLDWLADQGLLRDRDVKVISTPTDDSVGNVVVRGDARAAMLSGGELRAIPDALRAQLQIFTRFAELPGFMLMTHPRLDAAAKRGLRDSVNRFATASDEGKAFFSATGFVGVRDVPIGLMESLDMYADATRRALRA